jgi:hypothetical protein
MEVPRKKQQYLSFEHPQAGNSIYSLKEKARIGYLIPDILLIPYSYGLSAILDYSTGAIYSFPKDSLFVNLQKDTALKQLYIKKEPEAVIKTIAFENQLKQKDDSVKQIKSNIARAKYLEKYAEKQIRDSIRVVEWNKKSLSDAKNSISLNLGQLYINELQLNFERFVARHESIVFTLGYKIPRSSDKTYEAKRTPYNDILLMPFSNSYYLEGAYKYYYSGKRFNTSYLSIGAFYRYSTYEDAQISWHDPTFGSFGHYKTYKQTLDAIVHSMGLKLILGTYSPTLKIGSNSGIKLDIYGGISLRYKHIYLNRPEPNTWNEHNFTLIPSVHLGLKAGFAWKK